jgi:class 3 adenylate cyclase
MTSPVHTFLFTDLVGFTALAAERGDDHAAETAIDFYERVRRLVADHRAEEVKTIGDALMLRCDDPGLAIRLGLRIVRDLEAVEDFPAVRVGMHTGPAVTRAQDWYGTTVNLAARLCEAAGGGEVLVSETTCDAAGRLPMVELDDRRLHWLKNVSDPVAAHVVRERACACERWRVMRPLKRIPRFEARGAVS